MAAPATPPSRSSRQLRGPTSRILLLPLLLLLFLFLRRRFLRLFDRLAKLLYGGHARRFQSILRNVLPNPRVMPSVYISTKHFEHIVGRAYFHSWTGASARTGGVSRLWPIRGTSLLRANSYLVVGGLNRPRAGVHGPTVNGRTRDFCTSLFHGNHQVCGAGILRQAVAAPFHQSFLDLLLGLAVGEGIIHGLARIRQDQYHYRLRLQNKVWQQDLLFFLCAARS